MITAFLIVGFVAAGLALACTWADRAPKKSQPYDQPVHVHVLDDQEPNA